jgi:signal transduction histidine kinase
MIVTLIHIAMSARFYDRLKSIVLCLVKLLQLPKEARGKKLPNAVIISIFIICIIPSLLGGVGLNFAAPELIPDFEQLSQLEVSQVIPILHRSLRGSFIHTTLEWSAFSTALFTALLSLAHFSIRPTDAATPVIGLALFSAGCMDAFHVLAANHLIETVADSSNLVPFTWALCRLFNVSIMILGVGFFLVVKPTKSLRKSLLILLGLSGTLGLTAYVTIEMYATRQNLPETIFPAALVTRPWDVGPLILFILAGFFLYPRFYQKYPSLFSHGLMLSAIPDIAVQLHMAFGSKVLFDHHFNIAHFLKIIAYLVPLVGLILDYIYTNAALEESNQCLSLEILERQQTEAALRVSQYQLTQKTQELESTLQELQHTQMQLIQTEKMSSLGQLVGGIAHEINNPVNFIYGNLVHVQMAVEDLLGMISLYQQKYPQSDADIQDQMEEIDLDFIAEDTPKMLKSMQEGSRRIRTIVESLRNFSRLDESTVKSVDLQEGIESTLLILTQKLHSITVIKKYSQLPLVECYPAELNQVWMHLLTNAIDSFNDYQFQSLQQQPAIWIETIVVNSYQVCVKIKDNGCGIPEAIQPRIFDPFFTTKDVGKGTGLGLAVCYSIIKHHGGTIQVNSTPGAGTEFLIALSDSLKD